MSSWFDEKIIKLPFAICSSGKFTGMVANSHINITTACGPDSASCILIQSEPYGPGNTDTIYGDLEYTWDDYIQS